MLTAAQRHGLPQAAPCWSEARSSDSATQWFSFSQEHVTSIICDDSVIVINILASLSQEIKCAGEEKMECLDISVQCPFVWNWDDILCSRLTNIKGDFAFQCTVQRERVTIWCLTHTHTHTHTLTRTPLKHSPCHTLGLGCGASRRIFLWLVLHPMTHTARGPRVLENIPLSTQGCRLCS